MSDALRDAWISEMWAPCRELPREERAEKRTADRAIRWQIEESTSTPSIVDKQSTSCAEIDQEKSSGSAA